MGRALIIGGASFTSNYIDIINVDDTTTYYEVTTALTGYSIGSYSSSVVAGDRFTATLSLVPGYSAGSVTITMGGTNITSSAYNATTGAISIGSVTGNVHIRAIAVRDIVLTSWVHGLENATISSRANRDLAANNQFSLLNIGYYRGRSVERVKFYCNAIGTLTFSEVENVNNASFNVIRTLGSVTTTSADVGNVVIKDISFTFPSQNEVVVTGSVAGVLRGCNTSTFEDSVVPLTTAYGDPLTDNTSIEGKNAAIFWDLMIDFYATETPTAGQWFLGLTDFSQCQQALNSSTNDCWFVDTTKSEALRRKLVRKVKFKAGAAGDFVICYNYKQESGTAERAMATISVSASEVGTVVEKDVLFTIPRRGYIGLYNNPNGVLTYIYDTSLTSYQLQLVNPTDGSAMAGRDAYFDLFVM